LFGIYATYHELLPASISMAMLVARLFDVVTDLNIGYLSYRHHPQPGDFRGYCFIANAVHDAPLSV